MAIGNSGLHGFRKAASAWEEICAEIVEQEGFRGCLVIFRYEEKDVVGVVHGDDFVFGASDEHLSGGGSGGKLCHSSEGYFWSRS